MTNMFDGAILRDCITESYTFTARNQICEESHMSSPTLFPPTNIGSHPLDVEVSTAYGSLYKGHFRAC